MGTMLTLGAGPGAIVAAPAGPVAGYVARYKATSGVYKDAGVTLAANGETIQQWNDMTSNHYNLTQATSTNRPTYGTVQINGIDCPTFDGIDNFMQSATPSLGQPYQMFAVFKLGATTSPQRFWDGTNNNEGLFAVQSSVFAMYAGSFVSAASVNTSVHSISAIYNGASSELRISGLSVVTGNAGSNSRSGFTLGANGGLGTFGNVAVAEILIYSSTTAPLSSTDRDANLAYFTAAWGA